MSEAPKEQLDKSELKIELGGEFLFAEDFAVDGVWKSYALTIEQVFPENTLKTKQGRESKLINKPVIQFTRSNKKLVLSKTNQRLVRIAMGTNKVSEWIGKKLTLYVAGDIPAFSFVTTGIRIRCPENLIPYGIRKFLGKDLTGQAVNPETKQ